MKSPHQSQTVLDERAPHEQLTLATWNGGVKAGRTPEIARMHNGMVQNDEVGQIKSQRSNRLKNRDGPYPRLKGRVK